MNVTNQSEPFDQPEMNSADSNFVHRSICHLQALSNSNQQHQNNMISFPKMGNSVHLRVTGFNSRSACTILHANQKYKYSDKSSSLEKPKPSQSNRTVFTACCHQGTRGTFLLQFCSKRNERQSMYLSSMKLHVQHLRNHLFFRNRHPEPMYMYLLILSKK